MKSRLLRAAPALVLSLTALALASPILAQDPYCARPSDHQVVSDDGYGSYGYGNGDYSPSYGDDRQYSQYGYVQQPDLRYGHARQPYSRYGYGQQGYSRYGYQRPYSHGYGYGYGQQGYSRYGSQSPYESDCGNDYRGSEGGYVEDHVRSTFNLFPLPHFEKRIIRHYHPY